MIYTFTILLFVVFIYTLRSYILMRKHECTIGKLAIRIHVNGIRGKSSVTRLVSAALREGKVKTLAKTTGTAARVITSHRRETPVFRKEADIAEQRRTIYKYIERSTLKKKYKAIVFECMAINPLYQRYLENKIMQSTIGIITNVREDHTDVLGKTLPEIARNLASTIPYRGHFITAETDPAILSIFRDICLEKHTTMHAVGSMKISTKHMAKFSHFEYKSNVAIALKVAQLVGIPRTTALSGMYKALPDPGSFNLKRVSKIKNKTVHWANLFAINDRESFVLTVNQLHENVGKQCKKAVILNNRTDRPERVAQFVDICVSDIDADYIFTFGDYEQQVQHELRKYPDCQIKIVNLGNSTQYKNATGTTLLAKIRSSIEEKNVILYGAVNIHTPQAQALLATLEKRKYYA